jgi:hypothetical protein
MRGVETAKLARVHHLRWVPNDCSLSVLTLCTTCMHAAQRSLIAWTFFNNRLNPAQPKVAPHAIIGTRT